MTRAVFLVGKQVGVNICIVCDRCLLVITVIRVILVAIESHTVVM